MAKRVIIAPEKQPTAPQSRTAARQHRNIPAGEAAVPPAKSRMNRAVRTAESARRLPTDRSMPPVMMTIDMPMATMAITAIWLAMLSRFSDLRKLGQR